MPWQTRSVSGRLAYLLAVCCSLQQTSRSGQLKKIAQGAFTTPAAPASQADTPSRSPRHRIAVRAAVIAQDKLCDYLLNVAHRRGASKARLLLAMGYRPDDWQRLETDIRSQHLTGEVDRMTDTDYGPRYEIVAPLGGPAGWSATFRSVWQIDTGTAASRLITMYPE